MTRPVVTIGICVKNNEDFIEETVASILAQDFPLELAEIIVVDGYSTDQTLNVIRRHLSEAKMNHRIFHEKEGLGVARQIVVENARGKYILWVDGDLVISKNYLRRLFHLMEDNSRIGIAKGKYALTPGANSVATLEIYSRAASKMVDFNSRIATDSMGTAGCIYRTMAIKEVGGFDQNIKGYGEDWDAEYRVRNAGWLLQTTDVYYRDYERRGLTWKTIWRKYTRRGLDSVYIRQRKHDPLEFLKWTPPAAFVSGVLHSLSLYRLTSRKIVFLLPLEHAFKMTAWNLGYLKAYVSSRRVPFN